MAVKKEDDTQPVNQVLVTKDGLQKLKKELEYLKKTRIVEVAGRLREAISYGDLSENSEYEDAKNEQAFLLGQIQKLEQEVKNAKIIVEPKHTGNEVQIGSTITIQNLEDKVKDTYTIVGKTETDPLKGKISNESPVGMSLLGRKVGESVKVQVPEGVVEYKILKVS